MKRRNFLKLLGLSSLAPSVLCEKEKTKSIDMALPESDCVIWSVWQDGKCLGSGEFPQDYK